MQHRLASDMIDTSFPERCSFQLWRDTRVESKKAPEKMPWTAKRCNDCMVQDCVQQVQHLCTRAGHDAVKN